MNTRHCPRCGQEMPLEHPRCLVCGYAPPTNRCVQEQPETRGSVEEPAPVGPVSLPVQITKGILGAVGIMILIPLLLFGLFSIVEFILYATG
jgi:hypothetical protein